MTIHPCIAEDGRSPGEMDKASPVSRWYIILTDATDDKRREIPLRLLTAACYYLFAISWKMPIVRVEQGPTQTPPLRGSGSPDAQDSIRGNGVAYPHGRGVHLMSRRFPHYWPVWCPCSIARRTASMFTSTT